MSHYEDAKHFIAQAEENAGEDRVDLTMTDIGIAQVHAILALVSAVRGNDD